MRRGSQAGGSSHPSQEGDEDDYMTMTFAEPTKPAHVSSLERARLMRAEGEARGRQKSKATRDKEAAEKLQTALSSSLLTTDPTNRGAKMLLKMGYKPGQALGPSADSTDNVDTARLEPIRVSVRESGVGLGFDTAQKRKAQAAFEAQRDHLKRQKVGIEDWRTSNARERRTKQQEGQANAAMAIAESLSGDTIDVKSVSEIRKTNVLWRQLAVQRSEKQTMQRRQQACKDGYTINSLAQVADREEDEDDRIAMGTAVVEIESPDEVDLDEANAADDELATFLGLSPEERLQLVTDYLRTEHRYCFWCKHQYPDDEMDGCPGVMEDVHG